MTRLHAVLVAAVLTVAASGQANAAKFANQVATTTTQVGGVRATKQKPEAPRRGSPAVTVPPSVAKKIPKDKRFRCPKWEPMIRQAGLPVQAFSYIAWRESRCQPKAIGWNYKAGKSHRDCRLAPAAKYKKCRAVKSYDSGLFQINSTWTTVTAQACGSQWGDMSVLLSPTCNIKVATVLYDNGNGFSNWSL